MCLYSQHRAPLYCILRLAGSKKAELRVAGAREKGAASTLQNCRELPQIPAAQDWLRPSGECQAFLALVEEGQGEWEEWEVYVRKKCQNECLGLYKEGSHSADINKKNSNLVGR